MAIKLPEIFSRTDAKSRLTIVGATILGIIAIIYAISHFFGSGPNLGGAARVANAPSSLQSVPGGQLTPEYSRALAQQNAQVAQKAQSTGGSSVATLVNTAGMDQSTQSSSGSTNCTVVCPGAEAADVTQGINDLVKQGKLTQAEANNLLTLAKNNVPVSQYAAALDELVKEGKITPDQARQLLETYTKQHSNALVAGSAQTMDALIKSGKLPLDVATSLLDMQKQHVSPAEYSAELNRLVAEGKISPEVAAQLLAQYTQQQAKEAQQESAATLEDMAKSGQIAPDVADDLEKLQKRNVPAAEYQAELDKLVAEGKMTPATAAKLLAQYRSQRTSLGPAATLAAMVSASEAASAAEAASVTPADEAAEQDAANDVNDLVASGKITQATADQLIALQKSHVTPEDYQKALDQLVREGKISPEDAKRLMAKYQLLDLERKHVPPAEYKAAVDQMVKDGRLSAADAAKVMGKYQLGLLANSHASPAEYQAALDQMVKDGKITPAEAAHMMAQYQLAQLASRHASPAEYQAELDQLVKEGKITPAEAAHMMGQYQLSELASKHATPAEYQAALDEMVKEGKISPAEAEALMANYERSQGLPDEAKKLQDMQANNVSPAEYAAELKRAVAAGLITADQAATLEQEYQALSAPFVGGNNIGAQGIGVQNNLPPTNDLAKLQARLQSEQAQAIVARPAAPQQIATRTGVSPNANPDQYAENAAKEAAQAAADAEKARAERIKQLTAAMEGQAHALISSWQPQAMQHKAGTPETETKGGAGKSGSGSSSLFGSSSSSISSPPLIKAGSILFATLDTAINSDFPDTPVLATIVTGPLKGAKLLGKIQVSTNAVTQAADRVSLVFNLMDMEDWPNTRSCNAFAIDPQTAHTVLASSVDYHYFMRYGAMLGSSFLTGFANAISQSNSTTTSGIFGTSTTHPVLSSGNKIMVGLGQVGTTLSTATANYINMPPTVKVNAGVGIGVLFMSNVSGDSTSTTTTTSTSTSNIPPITAGASSVAANLAAKKS